MSSNLSALLLDLYRGSRRIEPDAFQEWSFDLIQKHVPFDSGSWVSGVLLEPGLIVHSSYLYSLPDHIIMDYMRIGREDPLYRRMALTAGTTVCMTAADYDTPIMREHIEKYRIAEVLGTRIIDPVTNIRTSICWFRAPGGAPFTEEDRLFKEQLMPHLAETWAESRVNYALKSCDMDHRPNHGVALTDSKSILHFADELFGELATVEWPNWRGPYVPNAITPYLTSRRTESFVGRFVVVTVNKLEDRWLLRARRKQAADSLGKREHQLARLAADGLSHEEIGKTLGMSATAVGNALTKLYQKLGVRDRTRLAKILDQGERE